MVVGGHDFNLRRGLMGKSHGIAEYNALAASKGLDWEGEKPPCYATSNTRWRCRNLDCRHGFTASYSAVKASSGCPKCARPAGGKQASSGRGLSRTHYGRLARLRCLRWTDNKVPQMRTGQTLWRCDKCDRDYVETYNTIQRGEQAHHPWHKVPLTGADYQNLGEEFDQTWEGEEVPETVKNVTDWRCKHCKTAWKTSFSKLQIGYDRCPTCHPKVEEPGANEE